MMGTSGTLHRVLRGTIVCLLTMTVALIPVAAAAAGYPAVHLAAAPTDQVRWSITPTDGQDGKSRQYFIYTISPGSTITDYAEVSNLGTNPITVNLYATDAFNTSDGAFALLTASQKPTGLGSWIDTQSSRITVAPGKQAKVPFRMSVPANATPGDHGAGIVASQLVHATGADNAKVAVDARVGARVYARVIGALKPALTVGGLTVSYNSATYPFGGRSADVRFQVTNTGNVELGGTGTLQLHGPLGIRAGSPQAVAIPALLPGSTYSGAVTVHGAIPLGRLSAQLHLQPVELDGLGHVQVAALDRTVTRWAVPWLIVGLLILVFLAWFAVRRIRARRTGSPQPLSTDDRGARWPAADDDDDEHAMPYAMDAPGTGSS